MYVYFQFKTQVGGISKSASFFICSRFQFLYKYIALIMYTWCQHVCECLTLQRPSLLAFREHSQQVYKLIVTPTCDSCRSFFLNVNCKKFLFYKNENDCNYKLPNTLTFLTHLLQLYGHSLSWFSITYNLSSKKLVWHVNQSVSCLNLEFFFCWLPSFLKFTPSLTAICWNWVEKMKLKCFLCSLIFLTIKLLNFFLSCEKLNLMCFSFFL